ncbi:MAG: radical SAM protein [Armatimonadia bacterium]|nr:radical SAM protein [Armatimonadia bacterium]
MLASYPYENGTIDSLDLKVLLVTQGLDIPVDEVVARFGESHRVRPIVSRGARSYQPDLETILLPEAFRLPDGTVIEMLNRGEASPFKMRLPGTGWPVIEHRGQELTEIHFFPRSTLFDRRTSTGTPFPKFAQLHGADTLWMTYYSECDFADRGKPCLFCFRGTKGRALGKQGTIKWHDPTPEEMAEVVEHAFVAEEGSTWDMTITGGSRIGDGGECAHVARIISTIDERVGLDRIPGEISVLMSAPRDPSAVDEVFEAGADRVSYDLEVWNPDLFAKICPGKASFVGRDEWIAALEYIRKTQGHQKACSIFVAGLEPLEDLLEGCEYLCSRGIVPLLDIWQTGEHPVLDRTAQPGLEYYRELRRRVAELYEKYSCEPQGRSGYSRCICRDTWNHREALQAGTDRVA